MVFKVKARVLLELGAELIGSDGIALYELIKNGIDAGSESIEVRIQVALTSSGYRLLEQELSTASARKVTNTFVTQALATCFDPSTPDELKEKFRAKLEGQTVAVARRKLRSYFKTHTFIEVEDWGDGMSASDLENNYLTVGTPNRAKQRATNHGANVILGEKGIGRLSVMRLGNDLLVITGTSAEDHWNKLRIDWSQLLDLEMDMEQFPVAPTEGEEKDRQNSGTLIRISDLKSDWSHQGLIKLAESELAKLQNPFDEEGDLLDLQLAFNGSSVEMGEQLDRSYLEKWHGYFDIDFDYVTDPLTREPQPRLTGIAKFRVPGQDPAEFSTEIDERTINAIGSDLLSMLSDTEFPTVADGRPGVSSRFDGIHTLGPFKATGYWFNRQRSQRELGQEYSGFKRWLALWAGGLLMYRDGYRVYPYAAPEDDWLELDQRALKQRSFKLNRGQFVGHVEISSTSNPYLKDQTNRQGLCDAPEKRALIQALQHVIWKELGSLVQKYEVKASRQSITTVKEIDKVVKEKSRTARDTLRELGRKVPDEASTIQALRDYIEDMEATWARAKTTIRKQENQAEMYVHLAGVGMLLEFVVHELTRVTTLTLADLKSAPATTLPPGLRSLSRQLQTLEKRLRILDPVATPGRQRKEKTDVGEVLHTLIDAHEQQFERHKIFVDFHEEGEPFFANVVAGQMYQVFENLISNSVFWLTHHRSVLARRRQGSEFAASISIAIDASASTITFTDNGGGIDPADSEKVFDPFFSKKPAGRGIGLFIVKNLCKENAINVALLPVRNGRIPGFVFTF